MRVNWGILAVLFALSACGDDDDDQRPSDAAPPDAVSADASVLPPDASAPDASAPDAFIADAAVPDAVLPDANTLEIELLAYWPFEGDGADVSGNELDVDLVGSPTFATGIAGQALQLDGTNAQYAVRPISDPVFDFADGDFTIQVWVRYAEAGREQTAIEKFSTGSGPGWTMTYASGTRSQFYSSPGVVLNGPTAAITTDVWYHHVIRRSGDTYTLFQNGEAIASASAASTLTATTLPLRIGHRNPGDARNFAVNGLVDEVAVWGRALEDDEVAAMWNGGAGAPVLP